MWGEEGVSERGRGLNTFMFHRERASRYGVVDKQERRDPGRGPSCDLSS